MKKDTIYYNKLWQEKKIEPNRLYMQERVLKTFKTLFSKILKSEFSGKVLDVGSGDGSFVQICKQNGIEANGIDICNGIDFEKDTLPFKESEFDIAVMYSVLEHLQSPGNILLEIHKVLKYRGKLIIITANFEIGNLFLYSGDFFNDPTHVHPYNRKSIKTLMKMYNFEERFLGLWTVCKSHMIWRLPETLQFYYGALLPFLGTTRYVPNFLKGKSKSMLCVFENNKGV